MTENADNKSEQVEQLEDPPVDDKDLEDSQAMRALLKRAMPAVDTEDVPDDYILKGVQKKLRQRSRGKFFGDGWSTTQTRMSYGLVAITMLIVLCLVFFALSPGTVMP